MIYSAESYLDDCLRLRGGVAPDEHTNRAVREVLSDLAAARREVETVTRERDEARLCAKYESDVAGDALQALATARAALEDVRRRVHTWLSADAYRKVAKGYNEAVAAYLPPSAMPITFRKTAAEAEDFPALGRALAQEAGDAAK